MKNINLEISDRDKKLLMVILALGILICSYYFGFSKLSAQVEKYETQVSTLTKKEKDLREKTANKNKYQTEAASLNTEFKTGIAKYRTLTSQPSQIDFLNQVESITGVWVRSITFANPEQIYQFSKSSTDTSDEMTGYRTVLTLNYEGKYEQWKDLLLFINQYSMKNTIDNISVSYEKEQGIVSGAITVSLYAIQGGDRQAEEPQFPVNTGTDNIFYK